MHVPVLILLFAIILYINYNTTKIKKYIRDAGLLWAISIGLIYCAVGAWILSGEANNITTLFLGLMVWVLFEIYRHTKPTSSISYEGSDEEITINPNTFYDVVAREIITMREQLTTLNLAQDSLGWDNFFSKQFIYKMQLYSRYKKRYLHGYYRPPHKEDEWGDIILIVGVDIFGDTIHDDYAYMNIEKLIKLHKGLEKSEHKIFHKGSTIALYMEEKDVYEDKFGTEEPLWAEILSIKKDYDIYYTETQITLKIDLNSNREPAPGRPDLEPEYIIRTIDLAHGHHLFIDDDSFNKSQNKFLSRIKQRRLFV